jgi:CHAD domain-containing protein
VTLIYNGAVQQAPGDRPLLDLVERRLSVVQKLVPAVLVGEEADDVHDLRVATRRLQQCLAALFPEPRPEQLRAIRRRLRKLRRALGEWRNGDVLLETVARKQRRARSEARRRLLGLLSADLAERRRRDMRRARRAILRLELGTLGDDVAALLRELPTNGSTPRARLEASFGEGWRQWHDAREHGAETRALADVHALRIAGKRLRYRIELVNELGGSEWKPVLVWLKGLQERLGDWHDRQVLYAATARALSRPEVFLESSNAVRAALAEIESARHQDERDLQAFFDDAAAAPTPPSQEAVAG